MIIIDYIYIYNIHEIQDGWILKSSQATSSEPASPAPSNPSATPSSVSGISAPSFATGDLAPGEDRASEAMWNSTQFMGISVEFLWNIYGISEYLWNICGISMMLVHITPISLWFMVYITIVNGMDMVFMVFWWDFLGFNIGIFDLCICICIQLMGISTKWGPSSLAKLVYSSSFTIVYGMYSYS